MFSDDTYDLCSKTESLSSLIQCIQASVGSDSMAQKDVFNVLGVALDISASIISGVKEYDDQNQIAGEKLPHLTLNSKTIGTRIRELRKALNLSQKQIAEQVGVTPSCITQWESDLISPNCDKIIPLANALECDPLWLLGK